MMTPQECVKRRAQAETAPKIMDQVKEAYLNDPDNFNKDDWSLSGFQRWEFKCWRTRKEGGVWNPFGVTEEDSLAEFEFTSIDGIGPSTAANVREHLKKENITSLKDVLECNLTEVKGMGNLTIRRLYSKIQEVTEEPYLFELPE